MRAFIWISARVEILAAAPDPLDGVQERLQRLRLEHVGVRAQGHGLRDELLLRAAREKDDPQPPQPPPQPVQHLDPVEPGQHHVEQEQVRAVLEAQVHRLLARCRPRRPPRSAPTPLPLEGRHQQFTHGPVVVDDDHADRLGIRG